MIIKTHHVGNFVSIANSLARDERLSLDTRGPLTMILSYPSSFELSVEFLLREINKGRGPEARIGTKGLRRMTSEMSSAGYLRILAITEPKTRRYVGKEWHVYSVSRTAPRLETEYEEFGEVYEDQAIAVPDTLSGNPHVEAKAPRVQMDQYPAAMIFAEKFNATLTLDQIKEIDQRVSRKHLELWKECVSDHYISLTADQMANANYRARGSKQILKDFKQALAEQEGKVKPTSGSKSVITDINHPDYKAPRRTFSDYMSTRDYDVGSQEYENFKKVWLKQAEDAGSQVAIDEVELYERQERTLAEFKARDRKLEE